MTDYFNKLENFWQRTAFSFLVIAFIFIFDALTPRGFATWILYMVPISIVPYKTIAKTRIYVISSVITVLIWSGFFIKSPGTIAPQIALTNRAFITLVLWIITYVQIQRSITHKNLLKSEDEFRKSGERFRVAQEVSPDGFVTFVPKLDAQGRVADFIFTFENEAAAKINGTKPDEVIGRGLIELFPGQKYTQFFRAYKEVYETKKTVEFIDHYKGDTFKNDTWFRVVAVPTSEGIAINAQNITEQKKSEEALIESQGKLIEAQNLARLGNYSIDFTNGGKMQWSDEMYNIWELDKNKPLPTVEEVWKRVHPDDLEELKKVLYSQLPGGEKVETVFRILFPGGRVKYVHIITKVAFDDNGSLMRREGIEMDITERKKAQIELERTLEKLERSNKELEQFAYIASHDLQEPLRMVSSYMGMLEKKYSQGLDEKAKDFIYYAVDGARRMSNLIKDLLAYSRVTTRAKEFTDTDLNKTFSDVTHDLQVLIKEKGAKINSAKLPVVKADPVQMHQLLQNIIGNALKFQNESAPEVTIGAEEIKNVWLFSVKDNGIGIDPQFFDRIFQVFQRLHEQDKYPGTGIGLALCKKIVERHSGKIWVKSEQGKGSTFYFTLPDHSS
ncbi:MAG: ATP-binding protein [Syntrophomonadaceae bacterium]